MLAVKAVDLGGLASGEGGGKKKKNQMGAESASGLAGVGDDGEWKVAGLPRRVERVAAEIKALRRLARRSGIGSGEPPGADEADGSGVRALFPAIHDFFILQSNATDSSTNESNAAGSCLGSTAVCHTVMTRCPGGKDLMTLLAAASGPGIPESQARFYAAEVRNCVRGGCDGGGDAVLLIFATITPDAIQLNGVVPLLLHASLFTHPFLFTYDCSRARDLFK